MSNLVIKPLEEEYEIVELRATTLESSLYPLDDFIVQSLKKQTPQRRNTTSYLWNIFEECVMSSILDSKAWSRMCEVNAARIRSLWWIEDSESKKDVQFLLYKLDNYHPVLIADEYYSSNIMSCQNSLKRFVECWKYLLILTWTSDLLMMDWWIRDIKYYWSYFWNKNHKPYDIITLENHKSSRIANKMQRYLYPRLIWNHTTDWSSFFYDVFSKSKNAPSKKSPDNHLKMDCIECYVDYDLAEKQITKDITRYFRLCVETGTKFWDKVWENI